jgi:hypothetical protein
MILGLVSLVVSITSLVMASKASDKADDALRKTAKARKLKDEELRNVRGGVQS